MAKYLVMANYTEEGLKGLLKDGGSKRREAVEKAVKGLGGTLECFYYAFGDVDVLGVVDLPDNVSATTFALLITAAGGCHTKDHGSHHPRRGRSGGQEDPRLSPTWRVAVQVGKSS